jgi:hypothetical protein
LPPAERGPELFFAFRRFAAICRSEAIGYSAASLNSPSITSVADSPNRRNLFFPAPFKLAIEGKTPQLCVRFPSIEGIDRFLTINVGPSQVLITLCCHSFASAELITIMG